MMPVCGRTTRTGISCKNKVKHPGNACRHHDKPTCAICLDYIRKDGLVTPCNHHFHFNCFEEWFQQPHASSEQCPLCRHNLNGLVLSPKQPGIPIDVTPCIARRKLIIGNDAIAPDLTHSDGWLWDLKSQSGVLPVYKIGPKTAVDTFTRAHAMWTTGTPLSLVPRASCQHNGSVNQLFTTNANLNGCSLKHWELSTRWAGEVFSQFCRKYPSYWNTLLADYFAYLLLQNDLQPMRPSLYQHLIVACVWNVLLSTVLLDAEVLWKAVRYYFANSEHEESIALKVREALAGYPDRSITAR